MAVVTYTCGLMNVGHNWLGAEPVTFGVSRSAAFLSQSVLVNSVKLEIFGNNGISAVRQSGSETKLVNLVNGETLLDYDGYIGAATNLGLWLDTSKDYLNLSSLKLSGGWQLGSGSSCVITVDFTPRNSTLTLPSSSVDAGATVRFGIACPDSTLAHRLTVTFGSAMQVWSVGAGATYLDAAIPLSFLRQIPSAVSGAATVTLETLDGSGNAIGTTSQGMMICCPDSVAPVLTGTCTPLFTVSGVTYANNGMYVQNKCGIRAALTVSGELYGATVATQIQIQKQSDARFKLVGAGSITLDSGVIPWKGQISVVFTVQDSRGKTAVQTVAVTAQGYDPPTASLNAWRVDESGAAAPQGGLGRYTAAASFSDLGGANALSAALSICAVGSTSRVGLSGGGNATNAAIADAAGAALALDPMVSYELCLTLTDDYECVSFTHVIPSAEFIVHFGAGGKRVAFGQVAEKDRTVEINPEWDFWMKGRKLLDLVWPVGCVMLGAGAACPAAAWGGEWAALGEVATGVTGWHRTA